MEGIIGVADMKDVDANAELAYKEISIIISKLKSYNITHITVCNIHNDGSCLNSEKINLLGAELVQGVHNLVPIINQFSISFMIGFHCKRNGGGRFGHTFRNDIVKMNLGLAIFLTIAYFSAALWAYQHSKILKSLNVKLRNETDIHFKLIRDILKGIKWICISNSGVFHYKRYAENIEYVKRQTINRDEKAWKLSYVSTIMGYGWNIIFLGYSIWQLGLNKLILTKFMLFLSYSRIYTSGIANLFERYSGLQPIRVSVERVFQLVDKYENQEKEERKTVFPEKLVEIEFVDLTFCYGNNGI